MAGNNDRTLTGTFNEIFRDSDLDDSDFEGFVFENAQAKIVSKDSIISIIIFYNIHF